MATIQVTLTTGAESDPLLVAYYTRVRQDPSPTGAKLKAWALQEIQEHFARLAMLESDLQSRERDEAKKAAINADVTVS